MKKPNMLPINEKAFREKAEYVTSLPDTPADGTIENPQKEALVVVDGGVEQGVLIPVIGQGVSAGFGFDYEEGEILRYVKVPAWLSRDGHNLIAVPVFGESMEPTLSRGNLAICDLGGFKDDGVYVLRDEDRGLMFCKRLVWSPGGWTIVSDNPRYEPMKVEDRAIEVVARVIAAIKEVK
ncbi:MAG: S24 family peptidase [Treponema sp.]|nr:S24 family peptidase [Treponema sp.]